MIHYFSIHYTWRSLYILSPFDPTLVLYEQTHCIDWISILLLTSNDKDIDFLVPDSCRATFKSYQSVSHNLPSCIFLSG